MYKRRTEKNSLGQAKMSFSVKYHKEIIVVENEIVIIINIFVSNFHVFRFLFLYY